MTNHSATTNRLYEQLAERVIRWAETRSDIGAVIMLGSRARVDHSADEWADLDVVIVTSDPEHYLSTIEWTEHIGKPLLTFLEPTATGGQMERRVLFEGMLDVDFSIISRALVEQLLQNEIPPEVAETFSRGIRVLVDKDGLADKFSANVSSAKPLSIGPPDEHEFLEVVHDFLYHVVWTVKKLRRGELWTAKFCLDSYMKWRCVLRMMEWQARASKGWTCDTWHNGRFLEEWADPSVLKGLRETFAVYDEADVKRGLMATMDLFRKIAVEVAGRLGYSYPIELDRQVAEWVRTRLSEGRVI